MERGAVLQSCERQSSRLQPWAWGSPLNQPIARPLPYDATGLVQQLAFASPPQLAPGRPSGITMPAQVPLLGEMQQQQQQQQQQQTPSSAAALTPASSAQQRQQQQQTPSSAVALTPAFSGQQQQTPSSAVALTPAFSGQQRRQHQQQQQQQTLLPPLPPSLLNQVQQQGVQHQLSPEGGSAAGAALDIMTETHFGTAPQQQTPVSALAAREHPLQAAHASPAVLHTPLQLGAQLAGQQLTAAAKEQPPAHLQHQTQQPEQHLAASPAESPALKPPPAGGGPAACLALPPAPGSWMPQLPAKADDAYLPPAADVPLGAPPGAEQSAAAAAPEAQQPAAPPPPALSEAAAQQASPARQRHRLVSVAVPGEETAYLPLPQARPTCSSPDQESAEESAPATGDSDPAATLDQEAASELDAVPMPDAADNGAESGANSGAFCSADSGDDGGSGVAGGAGGAEGVPAADVVQSAGTTQPAARASTPPCAAGEQPDRMRQPSLAQAADALSPESPAADGVAAAELDVAAAAPQTSQVCSWLVRALCTCVTPALPSCCLLWDQYAC